MKIRMKVQMSGTRNGQRWPEIGKVTDLPTVEAAHLVASGIAEKVEDRDKVEIAAAPEGEVSKPPEAKPASRRRQRPAKGDTGKE
ncbi:hypothetical protein ABZ070_02365 [Streptomyces sp. NPDC006283]|uniref:hypothetical protein n=1 Tax=Streptomyces sp. NPDC006283 TaxID=3156741 RepID=UPI0033B62365